MYPKTLPELARMALEIQNACNLSGVVRSYAEALSALWALPECRGTEWVNTHPVSVLLADKVAHLAGTQAAGNVDAVSDAYRWARSLVGAAA